MPYVQSVVVIGAGACGLTAIKACLEEGLKVTCYELTNHLGGVWKYNEKDVDDAPSMFQNIYMNTCKEMVAFSDFPPPKDLPNFMHHSLFYRYLESYAKTYQLTEHIQFRHKVTKVVPVEDFDSSGNWRVQVADLAYSASREEVFDAVIVATGQHIFPFKPDVPGLEEFQGEVSHSRSYKKPDSFKEKAVLVYGLGNSGVDVATDIARIAKKVYLSSRSGNWIVKRLGASGQPSDAENNRRSVQLFWSLVPRYWASTIFERRINNNIMDHKLYGLNPKHRFVDQIPRASETLAPYIAHGMIEMQPNIQKFTKNGVVFEGSHKEVPIDAMVFCTGFKLIFPFINKDIADPQEQLENMYKFVFPIKLRHHTMAFMGLTVPDQSITTMAELEARWAARVFTGKATLPSNSDMLAETENYLSKFKSIHGEKYHHPTFVRCIPHMDDLASQIGAKPDLVKLLFTDLKLLWHVFFGPCAPYQYRLHGPHSWEGARNAILTVEDRIKYPFMKINKKSSFEIQWLCAITAIIVLLLSWYILSY